jgi:hypothetical protein
MIQFLYKGYSNSLYVTMIYISNNHHYLHTSCDKKVILYL